MRRQILWLTILVSLYVVNSCGDQYDNESQYGNSPVGTIKYIDAITISDDDVKIFDSGKNGIDTLVYINECPNGEKCLEGEKCNFETLTCEPKCSSPAPIYCKNECCPENYECVGKEYGGFCKPIGADYCGFIDSG